MIFNGVDNPKCFFCEYSKKTENEEILLCELKKKEVDENFLCKKYKYDVFKRIVKRKRNLEFSNFSEEDFKL